MPPFIDVPSAAFKATNPCPPKTPELWLIALHHDSVVPRAPIYLCAICYLQRNQPLSTQDTWSMMSSFAPWKIKLAEPPFIYVSSAASKTTNPWPAKTPELWLIALHHDNVVPGAPIYLCAICYLQDNQPLTTQHNWNMKWHCTKTV